MGPAGQAGQEGRVAGRASRTGKASSKFCGIKIGDDMFYWRVKWSDVYNDLGTSGMCSSGVREVVLVVYLAGTYDVYNV